MIGCKEENREICSIKFGETNSISQKSSRKTWVLFLLRKKALNVIHRLEINDPLIRREFERLQERSYEELHNLCIEIIGDLS